MILHFKFERHLWLRDDLVDWLEAFARIRFNVDEIDLVLPMPSTLWHRLDRGYNQCEHLARALARRLGRPYSAWTLRRKGLFLRRQGGLDEAARRENARDSFAVRFPLAVRHRTLLVVDDVMTTGATLSECARSLKAAGAARVWCLTLARTWRA